MELTKFDISGYFMINGEKSDFIQHRATVYNRSQLDEYRKKLKAKTGHDIALVHTEKPLFEKFIWKGVKSDK